jgi:thioredoxin-dependent peroxiredoxin
MLKKGNKAPTFALQNQNGEIVKLTDFKGQKLIIYFYPKDNTPTCTTQACNLRDNFGLLKKKGYAVVGVSADTVKKHKNFAAKYSLPFSLLADEEQTMVNAYGVWGEKMLYGKKYMGIIRTTFLINEQQKIDHIITSPVSASHTEEILLIWDKK